MPFTDLKFGSWIDFYRTSWQFCSPHSAFSTFQQSPQLLRLHKLVPLLKYKLRSRWKWFTRHRQLSVNIGNEDNTFTSWVPRGNKPNTYSAPTIASNQLLVLLFQKSSQSVFDFHQLLVTSAPVYKRCWENFSNCLQCCLAVSKILYNLLIVVKNIEPPGFSNCEHFLKKCS